MFWLANTIQENAHEDTSWMPEYPVIDLSFHYCGTIAPTPLPATIRLMNDRLDYSRVLGILQVHAKSLDGASRFGQLVAEIGSQCSGRRAVSPSRVRYGTTQPRGAGKHATIEVLIAVDL
jgi:hypothetical protein